MSAKDDQPTTLRSSNSPNNIHSSDDDELHRDNKIASSDINRNYQCICGGKNYPDWIACDHVDCPIVWYHLVCLNITEIPVGLWHCPRCRPSKPSSSRSGAAQPRPQVPGFPNLVQSKFSAPKVEEKLPFKRGVPIKKGVAVVIPKPKPRWKGWMEVSAEEEDQYKQKIEKPWEDTTMRQRTRRGNEESVRTPKRRKPQYQAAAPSTPTKYEPKAPSNVDQQSPEAPVASLPVGNKLRKQPQGAQTSGVDDRKASASSTPPNNPRLDLSAYGGAVAWRS